MVDTSCSFASRFEMFDLVAGVVVEFTGEGGGDVVVVGFSVVLVDVVVVVVVVAWVVVVVVVVVGGIKFASITAKILVRELSAL